LRKKLDKFSDDIAKRQKLIICARLGEKKINPKRCAFFLVGARRGGSHNYNSHPGAPLAAAKRGQNLEAIRAR